MKTKDAFKNGTKYFRELSVVVVGIIITFGLSNWIGNRNEKKDVQRYLEAVKVELEDNLVIVKRQFEFYDQTGKLARYLLSDEPEKLRADSLAKYEKIRGYIDYMTYKTSSFEMLKSSGAMRLVKNKELLKSMIDCYRLMEYTKNAADKYTDTKWNELTRAFVDNAVPKADFDLREPKYRRLFNFFSIDIQGEGNFRDCEKQIEKTLSMF